MRLFHYHLALTLVRELETEYVERGYALVARYGRVGAEQVSFDAGHGWEELDALGFRLRLTQLEQNGIEVVVQPGKTPRPLVDHVGVLGELDELSAVLERAADRGLAVQDRRRRTFVSTGAGLRLELRADEGGEVAPLELELAAADPVDIASALASLLGVPDDEGRVVEVGRSTIRFVSGGPSGRPALVADVLVPAS